MDKIILIQHGGLGDHLQFSTLPEAFHKKGYRTFISDKSSYRSMETFDLVWGMNPYVSGISKDEPNCGNITTPQLEDFFRENEYLNRNWEIFFGCEDVITENNGKYGNIYYEPKYDELYENSVVIDINATANAHNYDYDKINYYLENKITDYEKVYLIKPNIVNYSKVSNNLIKVKNSIEINIENIYQYCDIINSTSKFICLWSGSSVLSSIIKNKYNNKLEIYCFSDTTRKWAFFYDNVNYLRGYMKNNL